MCKMRWANELVARGHVLAVWVVHVHCGGACVGHYSSRGVVWRRTVEQRRPGSERGVRMVALVKEYRGRASKSHPGLKNSRHVQIGRLAMWRPRARCIGIGGRVRSVDRRATRSQMKAAREFERRRETWREEATAHSHATLSSAAAPQRSTRYTHTWPSSLPLTTTSSASQQYKSPAEWSISTVIQTILLSW